MTLPLATPKLMHMNRMQPVLAAERRQVSDNHWLTLRADEAGIHRLRRLLSVAGFFPLL
jgi:hypothetical protein